MLGDTVVSDGKEFIVIWDGGEGLIPARETRVSDTWESPKRIYNKTGVHSVKEQRKKALALLAEIDISDLVDDTSDMEDLE